MMTMMSASVYLAPRLRSVLAKDSITTGLWRDWQHVRRVALCRLYPIGSFIIVIARKPTVNFAYLIPHLLGFRTIFDH